MKKQYVIGLAILLSVSGVLSSCGNKVSKNTGDLVFDSIQVNKTTHLFGDTAKPACNLIINYIYPIKSSDKRLKDSLNSYFTSACFNVKDPEMSAKEVVKQFTDNYTNQYRHDLEPMYTEDQKQKKNEDEETSVNSWYSYYKGVQGHVQFYKGNLLIYRVNYNEYTGGAHGMYTTTFLNINLATLRPIHLDDIFTGDYSELLTDLLWNQLMADNKVTTRKELEDLAYGSTGDLVPTDNFYLTKEGIVFYFNVYEFTPYVMGPVQIKLPYEIMQHIMVNDNSIINELRN
ncbi:DUF3298 domain-containing protein [uncultured Bacteroides sp.]|uniref:DUF3298 and DUF4163 domain-containing protein n=1 Tax=uncultured Bacteroides sp. TaxID=162156 RepID=UPI002AA7DA80|nr:DUF3298 domain-containing protein [uncultured Bacteroides sp.]